MLQGSFALFLLHVKDDAASNGSGFQILVHLLEVTQGQLLEGYFYLATSGDVNGLDGILTVSDIRTDYTNALEDGEEDGGLEMSGSG